MTAGDRIHNILDLDVTIETLKMSPVRAMAINYSGGQSPIILFSQALAFKLQEHRRRVLCFGRPMPSNLQRSYQTRSWDALEDVCLHNCPSVAGDGLRFCLVSPIISETSGCFLSADWKKLSPPIVNIDQVTKRCGYCRGWHRYWSNIMAD